MSKSPTPAIEIAQQAVASAVTWAIQDDHEISADALAAVAVKVAHAIGAGFLVFSPAASPAAPNPSTER